MTDSFALDFHDSEVRAIDVADGTLRVGLPAAHGRRASDATWGYLAGVEIAMTGASCRGDLAHGFGRLVDGRLRADGRDVPLVVPLRLAAALMLDLHFANGTRLEITAAAIDIRADDTTRFKEDFSC